MPIPCHITAAMHACVLMTELQVEKAKVRLDKWEDTKQPLLEDFDTSLLR